jgi:hypothetical protein
MIYRKPCTVKDAGLFIAIYCDFFAGIARVSGSRNWFRLLMLFIPAKRSGNNFRPIVFFLVKRFLLKG